MRLAIFGGLNLISIAIYAHAGLSRPIVLGLFAIIVLIDCIIQDLREWKDNK